MDRREALGTSLTFGAGFIGGGMISGILGLLHAQGRANEEADEVRKEYRERLDEERAEHSFPEVLTEGNNQFTLNPEESEAYKLDQTQGELHRLTYVVLSDFPLDVLVMSPEAYTAYQSGEDTGADMLASSPNTTYGTGETTYAGGGYLVIDYTSRFEANPGPSPTRVDVAYRVEV